MILTAKHITLIGRERVKKGPQKGQLVEIVKRYEFVAYFNFFKVHVDFSLELL